MPGTKTTRKSASKGRLRQRSQTRKIASAPPPGPYQCHPRIGNTRPAAGCLPVSILKRAAGKLGVTTASPVALRKTLEEKLGVDADKEASFVKALPFSQDEKTYLVKQYLRPPQPAAWKEDPDMWLDSNNIEAVMKQYEEANPKFEFMGPYPIDFAAPDPYQKDKDGGQKCLIREMCGIRVQESLKKGNLYIGIIYNLDPHYKDGSHWVANYIDIARHKCYYFDSYGLEPPSQVARFMKWLTTQDPKMKLAYNARRFQFQGSECGMYSTYFIIRMLGGDNFRAFCRRSPRDSAMLELRDWIFST
jgi:hypothetical protein